MEDKLQKILDLVDEYIKEKDTNKKRWEAGKDWVQYAGPYFDSDEYIRGIKTFLQGWLVLGNEAIEFEKRFPTLFGKGCGIVTNSGSSANLLMVSALKSKSLYSLPRGSGIIVPVAGFPTTLNPILQNEFFPAFVDIELDTLNLRVDQLEAAIDEATKFTRVRAMMFAHVLGNPPNMDKIMELVKKYNLILLEDCCDGLGSTYKGQPLGSFGEMASCSFYPAHHITTAGEGGFVACRTLEQERVVRSLREWGRGCYCVGKKANLSMSGTCGKRFGEWLPAMPGTVFDHKYVYTEIGYNLKPIEFQCAVGLAQLEKLPVIHQKRKENYARLFEFFSKYEDYFYLPRPTEGAEPSWFAFPLTIRNGAPFKRAEIRSALEEHKIQTRNYFGGNLMLQPAYKAITSENQARYRDYFPNATKATTDTFFLGTSPVISSEQIDYIKEVMETFLKSYKQ